MMWKDNAIKGQKGLSTTFQGYVSSIHVYFKLKNTFYDISLYHCKYSQQGNYNCQTLALGVQVYSFKYTIFEMHIFHCTSKYLNFMLPSSGKHASSMFVNGKF